jgi:hypothetical protein
MKYTTASTGYLNFGTNLYELSQRAKGMRDEQRSLIRLVFEKLILDEHKLSWEYSKAFKILSRAVEETNCSKVDKIDDFENGKFELTKKSDVTGQTGDLLPQRPIWLPLKDLFCKRQIEFGVDFSQLKILFEALRFRSVYAIM